MDRNHVGNSAHTFACFAPDCSERKREGVKVTVIVGGDRRPIPFVVCPFCRTIMTATGRDFDAQDAS